MKQLKIGFLLFAILLLSCSKNPTKSNGYDISGTISNTEGPVINAKISIDETANWTEYTDYNGHFKITGVTEGEHSLKIEKIDNDMYIEKTNTLQVSDDLVLNSLKLPIPVAIHDIKNITVSEVTIEWNSTDAEDFREYKLFRNTTPGLDENTGELIYVSTSRMDTSYKDTNLVSGLTYYYRVYLMNDYGRIGGSNIIKAKTKIGNLIPDGGFEIPGSISENWQDSWGGELSFEYDDSIKVSGAYAFHKENLQPEGQTYPNSTDMSLIKPITLAPGVTYKFSAWMKASGMAQGTTEWVNIVLKPINGWTGSTSLVVSDAKATSEPVEIEWTYCSHIFTVQEEKQFTCQINSGFNDFWIDDLELIVIE